MGENSTKACEICLKFFAPYRSKDKYCSSICYSIARKQQYHGNYEKNRNYYYKKIYGITLEQFNKTLQKQDGCCAICDEVSSHKRHKHLSVDHDHKTGKVRGILCDNCNQGLGKFKECRKLLMKAAEYLNAE